MTPSVAKLVGEVADIIKNPKLEAKKKIATEGVSFAGEKAMKAMIPVHKRLSEYKERFPVINNEDIATVAALAELLYDDLLQIEINGTSLRRKSGEMNSFPLTYLDRGLLIKADRSLDETVLRLTKMRAAFKTGIPYCISILAVSKYLDLRELASNFSSLQIADAWLVKETIGTCEDGVEVCNKGLEWAGQHNKLIDEFLKPSKPTAKAAAKT